MSNTTTSGSGVVDSLQGGTGSGLSDVVLNGIVVDPWNDNEGSQLVSADFNSLDFYFWDSDSSEFDLEVDPEYFDVTTSDSVFTMTVDDSDSGDITTDFACLQEGIGGAQLWIKPVYDDGMDYDDLEVSFSKQCVFPYMNIELYKAIGALSTSTTWVATNEVDQEVLEGYEATSSTTYLDIWLDESTG